jgi:hypothetical protein
MKFTVERVKNLGHFFLAEVLCDFTTSLLCQAFQYAYPGPLCELCVCPDLMCIIRNVFHNKESQGFI